MSSVTNLNRVRKKDFFILCIDDSSMHVQMCTETLGNAGYQTGSASNGRDAFRLIKSRQPDMILLDIDMPVMNGISFLTVMKDDPDLHDVPVIMVSSLLEPEIIKECFSLGAVDYIRKPYDQDEFVMRINLQYENICIRRWNHYQKRFLESTVLEKVDETKKVKNAMIFSLARLAESRDPSTGGHLERIQSYVRCLSEKMYESGQFSSLVNRDFIEDIFNVSVLHDIGKVGIPDSILLKEGSLKPEEYEIMKRHTVIGGRALEEIARNYKTLKYIEMGKNIAYYHHEKWDGSGYPKGLAGNDIPLESRICAIADVYDALIEKRVYKNALPPEEVEAIMDQEDGSSFDPRVYRIFQENKHSFRKIHWELSKISA